MPDVAPKHSGSFFSAGADLANSVPTSIAASATINTKGTWTGFGTTWSRPFVGFWFFRRPVTANAQILMDIGYTIDAGTTWVTLIPNLAMNHQTSLIRSDYFPFAIPRNAQFGARIQSNVASATCRVMVMPVPGDSYYPGGLQKARDWGAGTSNSLLTAVDPGATINTKGAWVAYAGFTVVNKARAIALAVHDNTNAAPSAFNWLIDVAWGDASNKNILLNNIPRSDSATVGLMGPDFYGWFPCSIPKTAVLYVRAQCSGNDATDRVLGVGLYTGH